MGSGEASIAQERRAAGKDNFISRLDMRVSAHDGAYLAIQHSAHGDFFASCFRMEIHKNNWRLWRQPFHLFAHRQKWIFQITPHKGATLRVDDANRRQAFTLQHRAPLPGCAGRIIDRPHKTWLAVE